MHPCKSARFDSNFCKRLSKIINQQRKKAHNFIFDTSAEETLAVKAVPSFI